MVFPMKKPRQESRSETLTTSTRRYSKRSRPTRSHRPTPPWTIRASKSRQSFGPRRWTTRRSTSTSRWRRRGGTVAPEQVDTRPCSLPSAKPRVPDLSLPPLRMRKRLERFGGRRPRWPSRPPPSNLKRRSAREIEARKKGRKMKAARSFWEPKPLNPKVRPKVVEKNLLF